MDYLDFVKQTSTTVGTGSLTLGAAATGFRSFSDGGLVVGKTTPYTIRFGNEFESGVGTLTSTTVLARTYVISSSNSNKLVNFGAGSKDVFATVLSATLKDGLTDPEDIGFDIILCAGQSNMAGRGVSDALIDLADSRLWQFGCTATEPATRYRRIFAGSDPLHFEEGVATNKVGPASWFGRIYADLTPSNRPILLVPVAQGGTAMASGASPPWAAGNPGGSLYELAITQVNLALAEANRTRPNSRVVGVIWSQGESDGTAGVSQTVYASALKAVIAGFRTRLTGASNTWFIIQGMVPEAISGNVGFPAINAAHIQVANDTNKCMFVAGPTGQTADSLHYNADACRINGSAMARAVKPAIRYVSTDTTPPAVSTVSVSNATPAIISMVMTEPMDGLFDPATSAFAVSGHTITAADVTGSTIQVTVSPAVVNAETLTITYTQPGTNAARDIAGNLLLSTAALAVTNNVLPNALAVTSSGPAGGAAGVSSTNFSVGVSPAPSNISGTLIVTPNDGANGGAFNPTSVNLTTTTPTGSFTYTPASTGVKVISCTNNGGLTNPAAINYTAGTSATAPAQMVAPVATAGNTSASVALTAPTDGGSAITGYTVVSTPAGGVDSNGGTTTLTHVMTGLVNSTSYTFTATATNAVGTSLASPASNAVVPVAAAFATWNPSDKNAGLTLSNSNKTVTGTAGATDTWMSARSTISKVAGKWYWEVTVSSTTPTLIGVGTSASSLSQFAGQNLTSWGYYSADGAIFNNGANAATGTPSVYTTGDVIGVAIDLDSATKTIRFYKNGVAQGGGPTTVSGTLFAMVSARDTAVAGLTTTNFGASAFSFTPPTGHAGLQ